MYTKSIPFKDLNGKPRNITVQFNLFEREVFKLLNEFKIVLEWRDTLGGPERELETSEVVTFYNAFEEILLSAYGHASDDGLNFVKGKRYEFEDSVLFNACMVEFVSNPEEAMKLLEGLLPKNLEDIVKRQDEGLARMALESKDEDLKAEVARLRAEIEERRGEQKEEQA